MEKIEYSVDPTLKEDIEALTQEKIGEVQKELAWTSAKDTLAKEKLERKFLSKIQTERIEVKAFEVCFF